jgi:hypothetical protein
MITDPSHLYRFFATPGIEVMNPLFDSDDVIWATWRIIAEENVHSPHTKEVIGACH